MPLNSFPIYVSVKGDAVGHGIQRRQVAAGRTEDAVGAVFHEVIGEDEIRAYGGIENAVAVAEGDEAVRIVDCVMINGEVLDG